MEPNFFTLAQISDWQSKPSESEVELPIIQRGFVWNPKQVEDLWDSLLRGYPIGSFICSRIGSKLYLMDGQQRSTSIFLGHFDPYDPAARHQAWSIKGELPVMWIDLKPKTKPLSSKYSFRLTTRSHPWGYQSVINDKKLELKHRRDALQLFKKHPVNTGGYTTFKNSTVFPYDSVYPLPLCFFINSEHAEQVIELAEKHLPDYFKTKEGGFADKGDFLKILREDLFTEIEHILVKVKTLRDLKLYAAVIHDSVLQENTHSDESDVFVRINSAGTSLSQDDLIYSIYKSVFPEAKTIIENIGITFVPAPQMLSHVIRIVVSNLNDNRFVKKISVHEFKSRLNDLKFKNALEKMLQEGKLENTINQALNILLAKDNPLIVENIPASLVKQIIRKNSDLFLFLVHWLWLHPEALDNFTQFRIVGKLLTFAWFDFSDISKLWDHIKNHEFWLEELNNSIKIGDEQGIQFLIDPKLLQQYYHQSKIVELFKTKHKDRWGLLEEGVGEQIINYYRSVKPAKFQTAMANDFFWNFIGKIKYKRELILFSQRKYINDTFGDFNQIDDILDTNTPWDWDHIYPSEWVYRKSKCNQAIKDWNNCNGNFRAISVEHNRSRKNLQSPSGITDPVERKQSFITDDFEYWNLIKTRITDDAIDNHFKAVTSRMINIYTKFWDDLKIGDLMVEHKSGSEITN